MPIIAKVLTDRKVTSLSKKPGFWPVGGTAGLHLAVSDTLAASWILRIRIPGAKKRPDLGVGSYREYSLAEARERALVMRKQIKDGIDPREHRRAVAAALAAQVPFKKATEALLEAKARAFSNAKHAAQWRTTLEQYALPALGEMPVGSIKPEDVAACLEPIWETKHETARRVRGRIEAVLAYGIAKGWCSAPNAADWRPIKAALPDAKSKVKHFESMPYAKVPAFMKRLATQDGIAARALQFAILTAARSGEVRGARWGEIDLRGKAWHVPAERMKARKAHLFTLNHEAIALLKAMPRGTDDDLIFSNARTGKALSDAALGKVLKDMGVAATPHGYRGSFRTWAAEQAHDVPREVPEASLAHGTPDETEAAYLHTTFAAQRHRLLDRWGAHCSGRTIKKAKS